MKFCIELAGVSVGICHRYDHIRALCRGYETDREPVFVAEATESQLRAESDRSGGQFSAAVCESTCLHRQIVLGLVRHGILLIHSAAVAVDGEAYVFLAKSGVGKSTHIRLWQQVFGDRAVVVNGDKPMFSFRGDTLMVHGSPWRGKEGLGAPVSMPVAAMCLLERGTVNEIRPAPQAQVVDRIFHQVLLPADREDSGAFFGILNRILQTVPFYQLKCNMDPEAALVAYRGMRKEQTL